MIFFFFLVKTKQKKINEQFYPLKINKKSPQRAKSKSKGDNDACRFHYRECPHLSLMRGKQVLVFRLTSSVSELYRGT